MIRESVEVVIRAALAYGVTVTVTPSSGVLDRSFLVGPLGSCGVRPRQRVLGIESDAHPDDALHELCHLVLGEASLNDRGCESWILMPFEWRLAKELALQMSRDERRFFLRRVTDYQNGTMVMGERMLDALGADVRRQKWWREGEHRCQRVGLLDDRMKPTYRMPNWKKGVPCRSPRGWEPG